MKDRADSFLDGADEFLDRPVVGKDRADDFLDAADAFLDASDDQARYDAEVSDKISALKRNPSTAYLPETAMANIAKGRTVGAGRTQGGIGDFVRDVGGAVASLPQQTAATIEGARLGNSPVEIAASETQRAVREKDARDALDPEKEYFLGLTSSDIKSGIKSIPFSFGSLGAYLIASLPARGAALLSGPASPVVGQIAGHAAGMAASAKAGYNMDVAAVLNQLYGAANSEYRKQSGRDMTPEEFGKFVDTPEIQDNLFKHGMAEAGFEAIGNLITSTAFGKVLKPIIGKMTGNVTEETIKTGAKKAGALGLAKAAGLSQLGEVATETPTQIAQSQAEVGLGLQKGPAPEWTSPDDWENAVREVIWPTVITTGAIAGGAKLASIPLDAHGNKVMSGKIADFIAKGGLSRLDNESLQIIHDRATDVLDARKKDGSIQESVGTIRQEMERRGIQVEGAEDTSRAPINADDFLDGVDSVENVLSGEARRPTQKGAEQERLGLPRPDQITRPPLVVTPEGGVGTEAQVEAARAVQDSRGTDLGTNEVAGAVQGRAPLPDAGQTDALPLEREPPDLLHVLAQVGLDRDHWESQGIDKAVFKDTRWTGGIGRPLFRKKGGMKADQTAEFMSQSGFLPEGQYNANDALALVNRALSGEKIYSQKYTRDVEERAYRQHEADQREQFAGRPGDAGIEYNAADLRGRMEEVGRNRVKQALGEDAAQNWQPKPDDFGLSGYSREAEDVQDIAEIVFDGARVMGDQWEPFYERFLIQNPDLEGDEFESTLRAAIRSHEDAQKPGVPSETRPRLQGRDEAAQAGEGPAQSRPASAEARPAAQEVTTPLPATAAAPAPEPSAPQPAAAKSEPSDLAGPVDQTKQAIHDKEAARQKKIDEAPPMEDGPGDLFSDKSQQADLFAPIVKAAEAMTKAAEALTESVKASKEEKPTANDRQHLIGTGEQLYSNSGRALSPSPKIDATTNGKINNSIKRINAWLLDEAKKEAEATSQDFLATTLKAIDLNNISQADQDALNLAVFGHEDGPQTKNLSAPDKSVAPTAPVDAAAHEAATSPQNGLPQPSEAQKEAGNYPKGHVKIGGLDISIENPEGSRRQPEWPVLKSHYGYIKRTEGADINEATGKPDSIDVFVKPGTPEDYNGPVFVIDQTNKDGDFDEHKVMLGFDTAVAAKAGYLENYTPGWTGFGAMKRFTLPEFKLWLKAGNTKKAVALGRAEPKPSQTPKVMSRFELGRRISGEIGQSSLRPSISEVRTAAEKLGVSIGEAQKALAAFNDPDGAGSAGREMVKAPKEPFTFAIKPEGDGFIIESDNGGGVVIDGKPNALFAGGNKNKVFKTSQEAELYAKSKKMTLVEAKPETRAVVPVAESKTDTGKIDDVGEKIGGARKDTAESTGPRGTQVKDETPGWRKRYEVSQVVKSMRPEEEGRWHIYDKRREDWRGQSDQVGDRKGYATQEEAEAAVPLVAVSRNHRVVPVTVKHVMTPEEADAMLAKDMATKDAESSKDSFAHALMGTAKKRLASGEITKEQYDRFEKQYGEAAARYTPTKFDAPDTAKETKYEIWRNVTDRKRLKIVDKQFDEREDAMRYMAQHATEIIETKTSFGEEILPVPDKVVREGPVKRKGNVTGEDFKETYGFRGVEFGLWNNQEERQQVMNHAYDALADLADTLNIPAAAIGLNGELALAFGARGQGLSGARAHYERNYGVINLTKMQGAGSLAHEWFHSLDHYFGRQDTKASSEKEINDRGDSVFKAKTAEQDMVSHGFRSDALSKVRPELRAAYKNVIDTMFRKAEKYVEDTQKADKFVADTRNDLANKLDSLRVELSRGPEQLTYMKRNNKPATAAQLAEFDGVAEKILAGEFLETAWKPGDNKTRRSMLSGRWTNDALEKLSAIYKAVRGRSGFDSQHQRGVMDNIRDTMRHHSQRLKMLAEAQSSEEKTRYIPTEYAREAKSIDQGRASDYWTTPHEMAARAFQAYVEDKISEKGGRSDFLTYGTKGLVVPTPWGWKKPFPSGDERTAINTAFDKFASEIKTKETSQGTALFSRSPSTTGLPADEVRAIIAPVLAKWKNAPPIEVVETSLQVPDAAATSGVEGAYLSNGTVYLVAANLPNRKRVMAVLAHEAIGHAAMEELFGNELPGILRDVALMEKAGNKAVREAAQQIDETQPGLNDEQRAKEIIAVMAERGVQNSLVKRVLAAVRRFLRSIGITLEFSDADLAGMLRSAERYLENGRGREADEGLQPAFSAKPPTWYSALARGLTAAKQAKATAADWKAIIAKMEGVKKDEIDAVGLNEFLDTQAGQVTRDHVLDFVRQNGVQVKEVTLGGEHSNQYEEYVTKMEAKYGEGYDTDTLTEAERTEQTRLWNKSQERGGTADLLPKFESYQLPGGENYRELLLTLPVKKVGVGEQPTFEQYFADATWGERAGRRLSTAAPEEMAEYRRLYEEALPRIARGTDEQSFRSTHFDEPNILAHVRFNERTDAEGKRVLFIEELQSDWAQKGRKDRFAKPVTPARRAEIDARLTEIQREKKPSVKNSGEYEALDVEERMLQEEKSGIGVPSAPFVTKTEAWSMLAMKRMIRYAAENGFDRVAWTTGEQQAARYDLSKQVRQIVVTPRTNAVTGERTRSVALDLVGSSVIRLGVNKDGVIDNTNSAQGFGDANGKPLSEVIGKELAERVMQSEWATFEGDDLKVGGEGMRAFYDVMLPQMVNKYVKKWGGKVGETNIGVGEGTRSDSYMVDNAPGPEGKWPVRNQDDVIEQMFDTQQEAQAAADRWNRMDGRIIPGHNANVPSLDITPAMRESVMQGQPLFSRKTIEATEAAAQAERDNMPKGILAAYKKRVGKIVDRIDKALDPMGNLPQSKEYMAKRYLTLGRIAKADEIAKGIGKAFANTTAEVKQQVYDFLTTRDAAPADITNELARADAVRVKHLIESVSDAMVARGLLSEETAEAHRGAYLPQLYLKWLLDESDVKALGTGKKPSDMGYLKGRKIERTTGTDGEARFVWRDSGVPLTDAQVLDLGPISDPGFLAASAIAKPVRDMALLDFLSAISKNEAWVLPNNLVEFDGALSTPQFLKTEADRLRKQADHYGPADADKARALADRMDTAANTALDTIGAADFKNYKEVPNTARYGRLRGLWVRKEIYEDLVGSSSMRVEEPGFAESMLGYGGKGTKITQLWKMSKVALNPPAQVRNFVSNGVLLQLSGVPLHKVPVYWVRAIKDIVDNGKYYQIAKKYGVTESTFATQELFRIKRDLLDLEMREGRLNPIGKMHRMGAIVADNASDAYQFSEALSKTAKIMHAMENGASEAEAAIEAMRWLFDYSLVPRSVRYLRNAPIGIPFLTFQFKVLPRLAEVALLHPQRLIPWVALYAGWPLLWALMTGEDDDEYKRLQKALPAWLQERGHAMILPYTDDEGRSQVLDLGYFMPWSMYTDVLRDVAKGEGGEALQTLGIFSGPMTNVIVAMKTGKDPFTGRDIVDNGDPVGRQFAAATSYVWDTMMPPIVSSRGLVSPMGLIDPEYGGKAVSAATGRTNKYGDPTATAAQAAMYPFGLNVYSIEPKHATAQNVLRYKYEADQTEISLKRKLQNRALSDEARREIVQEYTDELKRRYQKIEEYKNK